MVILLALAVPIVPFLALGESLDERIAAWLDPPPEPATVAAVTIAVLAVDVFLPVPSSLVSTFAGAQLGVVAATAASWLGMTAGAVFAFWLAKAFGHPLAVRLSSADDMRETERLSRRVGGWILIVTRPLPILAEAAVLLLGTTGMTWRRFLPLAMLSNLGIALVYSVLGRIARSYDALPIALGASVALPVLATTIARLLLRRTTASTEPTPE